MKKTTTYIVVALLCPKLSFLKRKTSAILFLILSLFCENTIQAQQTNLRLRGQVLSKSDLKPLVGATVKNQATGLATTTGTDGRFEFLTKDTSGVLTISFIGYQTTEISFNRFHTGPFQVLLNDDSNNLKEVVVSTGYQTLPKERATGSFAQVDNQLLNERVSPDILSRLEGNVPGLLFNRNTTTSASGQTDISIRGTSTLYSSSQPLIVVDNFPYDGDINNINPNDIESVTVLKDAAATSIWGVQSGNGVIVITTKKGKRNQKLLIELNVNVTIGNKPDLYYGNSFIKSTDYIYIEQNLFNKGYYDDQLGRAYDPITPVVQILADERAGNISSADATAQINSLRNIDVRNQESQVFYQKSVNQQYSLNMRGGSSNSDYVFSLGDDQDLSYYKGNQNGRITLNSVYNFYPVKNLTLTAGFNYIQSSATTNNPIYNNGGNLSLGSNPNYPYAQLADAKGNALPIAYDYALSYTNSANSQLLDWDYRPLDELNNADNTSKSIDNRLNLGLQYDFLKHFSFSLKYQYETASTDAQNYYSTATYYTRDLVNEYTQVNQDASLSYPIPIGGILLQNDSYLTSHHGRAQLNYNNTWNGHNEFNAIAGAEITDVVNGSNSNTTYGYDKSTGTSFSNIDYSDYFTVSPTGNGQQIPNSLGFGQTTNHYLSYFTNEAYTYQDKYTVSASGRIDKSNLFGVNTNQKAVPLYSTGLAWNLSKEDFYNLSWLPYAKLRATYGYTGNVNTTATGVTTISQRSHDYFSGGPYSVIASPGNPDLRFEKVRMINIGLDYGLKNNVIAGSIEYYTKKGTDEFGSSPLAPSTGLTTFFGNTADIKGNGLDIVINTKNINGNKLKWTSNFSLSHAVDIVTKYDVTLTSSNYIIESNASSIFPLAGKSIYGLYSYKWGGLTHNTGNPQGYLNGSLSSNYSSIISNTSINDMVYNGSSRPLYYGYLRNNFSYNALSLSFNIIYKLDYYFRKSSISALGFGGTDYYKRWQKPGDESTTNVPSLQYPDDPNRDQFYKNSSVLIDNGNHIRLQDITLSYDLNKAKIRSLPFSDLQLYSYINNVGILWRANKDHLDPDLSTNYNGVMPLPRTISLGVKAKF